MTEEKLKNANELARYIGYLRGVVDSIKEIPIRFHELNVGCTQEVIKKRAQTVNAKIRDLMLQILGKELAAVEEEFANL